MSYPMDIPVLILFGPTASGKTSLVFKLFSDSLSGAAELISADSMQVYRGMDIGTAKPSAEERSQLAHHLIDIRNPDEQFNAGDFVRLADSACVDIASRGKLPVVSGGTGFYINAVIYGTEFAPSENDTENKLRQDFAILAEEKGALFLHDKLRHADPAAAAAIHPNNIKRVARALSYCKLTGKAFSAYNAVQKAKEPIFDTNFSVLTMPREILYNRINQRTIAMWEAGLPDEVQNLFSKGYNLGLASMQGIGYKEAINFLQGRCTQAEAINSIQQATRNYAKRQDTWFRNQSQNARTVNADSKNPNDLAKEIK